MKQKIFLFGCWNKNQCVDGLKSDPRKEVLELLKNEPDDYDFGILLGDNIYPTKVKNTKKKRGRKLTIKKFLSSNVNKYEEVKDIANRITKEDVDISLHVVLGNHDVEKECVMRNQIRHFKSNTSNIYPKNGIFETENAVFLFLNTNNIGELIEFIHQFDPEIMNDRWLILCGHDPIFSYKPKNKKKKGKTKVRLFQKIDELPHIFAALSRINYPKMAYVCADTHNYQLLEVSYSSLTYDFAFPVIVVGTGGAEPDPLKDIEENKFYRNETSDLDVDIIDSEAPYGFLEMEISKDTLNINYKRCESENKANIHFNRKDEMNYTIDVRPRECDLPKYSCEYESPERNFLEIC